VQYAATVGIRYGVADIHEPTQEVAKGKATLTWITAWFLRLVKPSDRTL
jgi:hypothetical protein